MAFKIFSKLGVGVELFFDSLTEAEETNEAIQLLAKEYGYISFAQICILMECTQFDADDLARGWYDPVHTIVTGHTYYGSIILPEMHYNTYDEQLAKLGPPKLS